MQEIAVAMVLAGVGVLLAALGSRLAVAQSVKLASKFGLSPFVIGLTIVAIGTDLPEIANSVVSSWRGQGDLNVGDSYGSVFVQLTLALGLLPFVGGSFAPGGRAAVYQLCLAVVGLGAGAVLLRDGQFERIDAVFLLLIFVIAVWTALRPGTKSPDVESQVSNEVSVTRTLLLVLGGFLILAAGAALLVEGVLRLAVTLGAPPLAVGFIGASIGTSAPELIVAISAARRGNAQLAAGDILGASMADSTVSVALGPLLFPTAVTAAAATEAAGVAAGAVIVSIMIALRGRHTRVSGTLLLVLGVVGVIIIAR